MCYGRENSDLPMLKALRLVVLCLFAAGFAGVSRGQVVINEFMAENETGLQDDDKERSDWIELFNTSASPVNLAGWTLTDDPDVPAKWTFPSTNIAANGYLVVFASSKNRALPGKYLHTSFSLSSGGEYLALFKPDHKTAATEFAPEYPQQIANISYGIAPGTTSDLRYFGVPSPNLANSGGSPDVSIAPTFSLPGGPYTNNISVTLSSPQADAVIRYTLNGSDPTTTSTIYAGPIGVASTTVIRARAYVTGLIASPILTRTYTILDSTVANFSSNLPVLVLTTFSAQPNETAAIKVSAMLMGTNGTRAFLNGKPDFDGRGTIKIRGSSSTQFPKKSFAFELQDELGLDRKVSLLGMPKESDWVLYAPYTDKTLIRDVLAYEFSNRMGTYAPRTRMVEVYVDASGGKLTQSDYVGVYVLIEKIKRDDNRVNIQKLLPSQITAPQVTGGYIFKKDRLDPGDTGFTTTRSGTWGWVEPKEQELVAAQKNYMANFFTQFENALYAANFTNKAYAAFYDAAASIDMHLMVESFKNIDGYRLSTYAYKDRLGKIKMGPIWDYNLSLGNANYNDGEGTANWYYPYAGTEYPWWPQLFLDPDYKQQYADRWAEIRRGPFATAFFNARVMEIAGVLGEAAARNYQRWPILGQYVWPNASGYQNRTTYLSEITWMTNWIAGRFAWIDSQFVKAPTLNTPGGTLPGPTSVSIASSGGVPVYYTTDGSDPRAPGGGISSKAKLYSTVINIPDNRRVVARSRTASGLWSGPVAATYIVQPPLLAVTEIMYNPLADVSKDYEFIELKNVGTNALNLNGFRFTAGIDFTFTNSVWTNLPPGGIVVLVKNQAAFAARFDTVTNVAGQYTGTLENAGERIAIEGPMKESVLDFSYNNAWYPVTDGYGFSLVARDDHASFANWSNKENWRASANLGGSPGKDDPQVSRPNVLINEVLTHTENPQQLDSIELYNPGPVAVSIGNWFLSDDRGTARKYQIPADRTLGPGGYMVFTEADFNANPSATNSFALSSNGDEVYLFSADSAGNLTGVSDGFAYGPAADGVSFGRYAASDGKVYYPAQKSLTLGGANSGPIVGPVVINEIRYSPASFQSEYIELKNITSSPVDLFDSAHPTNTWRLNGIDFTFPTNVTIPAGGLVLVAQNGPDHFRATNGVPASVPIFGPFGGELQNDGENLQLLRPGPPEARGNGTTRVPMIVVDEVRFNDKAPWPTNVAGLASIERIYANQFGNDPINWRATTAGPSPGVENSGNRPPIVRVGEDQALVSGRYPLNAQLSAEVIDDGNPIPPGSLSFQWRQDSGPWFATVADPGAVSTAVTLPGPGDYVFSAVASDGSVEVSRQLLISVARPSGTTDLVAWGSVWNYLDTGVDMGTAWRTNSFVPGAEWKAGRAQLGYGDGDEVTTVDYGPDANNKYLTTYFRQNFSVPDLSAVGALTLRFVRDDGIVVYVNGREAKRDNLPDFGDILFNTPAINPIAGADESAINELSMDPSFLRKGDNLIAVEIHQSSGGSSDISFDLQLQASASGANQAPLVDAGPDISGTVGNWILLAGAHSDDGLPLTPGIPTIAWSSESDPASVTFASMSSARTQAKFSKAGVYTLAMTVNDGALSATDRVVVTVGADDGYAPWSAQNFSAAELLDASISGPSADADHDGMSNHDEFVCGTDPKSAASALRLVVTFSGIPAVQFEAAANRTYTIYYRASLDDGSWSSIATYPAGAARLESVTNPQPGYYRVAVP